MKDRIARFLLRYSGPITAGVIVIPLLLMIPFLKDFSAEDILQYTPSSPLLAALIIVLCYLVKCVLIIIPLQAMYISASLLFPLPIALLVTYIGLFVGFTVSYWIGRAIGINVLNDSLRKNKRSAQMVEFFERRRDMAIFFSRILPIPVELFSMFYGAMKVPYPHYIFLSLLGTTPTMVPFVIAGVSIANPLSVEFLLPFGISLLVSGGMVLLFGKIAKK